MSATTPGKLCMRCECRMLGTSKHVDVSMNSTNIWVTNLHRNRAEALGKSGIFLTRVAVLIGGNPSAVLNGGAFSVVAGNAVPERGSLQYSSNDDNLVKLTSASSALITENCKQHITHSKTAPHVIFRKYEQH